MVNLEKKGWLYKWYRFAGWNLSDFSWRMYEPKENTDLCRFVNTLFWGTLGFLWDLALWVGAFVVIFILPGVTAGFTSYLYVLGIPVISVSIVIGLVMFGIWLSEREDKGPGPVRKLASAAYDGWKNRFCPMVTFKEDKNV